MCREDVKKGHQIADNIRKVLLNIDLRLVYAQSRRQLAYEDFKKHAKLGGVVNDRKALRAKAESEVYRVYIENVQKIKADVSVSLNAVLSRYTSKYKQIWEMYFI